MFSYLQVFFIFLSCWSFSKSNACDSKKILDVIAPYNGVYSPLPSNQTAGRDYVRLEATVIPVVVPALPEKCVLFFKQLINGIVYRNLILVFTEGPDNIVYMTPYNFTGAKQYRSPTYNLSDLSTITAEDLRTDEGSQVTFEVVSPGVVNSKWPDTRTTINGIHPTYILNITCDGILVNGPQSSPENSSHAPVFVKCIRKFPLPGAPADYINPCTKTQ